MRRDVIAICAEQILEAAPGSYDGYVATGGTESNLQALWSFRNKVREERGLSHDAMAIVCSEDTHYSAWKAADILGLRCVQVPVDEQDRTILEAALEAEIDEATRNGVRHFFVILNMGTTMMGSVDDPDHVLGVFEKRGLDYMAHVDAAFGGFVYPLVTAKNKLSFRDPRISSFTLDGHKMLQSPYGTGVHLVRKGFIEHVRCSHASYVPGLDSTLCGSRSGANAVAMWMILRAYGSEKGQEFCRELVRRAARLQDALGRLGIRTYRHPDMNVVAIRRADTPPETQKHYMLVPESHDAEAKWAKLVVMDHVTDEVVGAFLEDLEAEHRKALP